MIDIDNCFGQIKGLNETSNKSKEWIKNNQDDCEDLNIILRGFSELLFAIPIFGGFGDKYINMHPWHHLFFEAEQDLDAAILLLMLGFYKDSFRSLRSFLELYIFGLYNFISEDENSFQSWLHGETGTPKFGQLIDIILKKNVYFKSIDEQIDWSGKIKSSYKELSGFIHTRGAFYTNTAIRNSSLTCFSEIGIKTGIKNLIEVIRLVSMGFVVNFPMSFHGLPLFEKFAFSPPAGGFLEEDQVERIKSIFPVDILGKLSNICLNNEDANSLADGVRSMRDLSVEEVYESFKKNLDSDLFINSKKEILSMMDDGEIDKAFVMMQAINRASTKALTSILFNPFYSQRPE